MLWYLTPYAIVPVSSTLISIVVFTMVWQYRKTSLARPFLVMMVAIIVWCVFQALELSYSSYRGKLIFTIIQHWGVSTIPIAWLCFALIYTGWERLMSRQLVMSLIVLQLPTFLGTTTNSLHHLFWSDTHILVLAGASTLTTSFGPLWYYHVCMSYLLILIGTLLIIRGLLRAPPIYRQQSAALLLGSFLPWVASILFVVGLRPFGFMDMTPLGFALSGVAISFGITHFHIMDLVPSARDVVIENMSDAVIVVDASRRIVDVNPAALRLAGIPIDAILGHTMSDLFPQHTALIGQFSSVEHASTTISLDRGHGPEHYDLRISPVRGRRGLVTGRLLVLRDIGEQKRVEQEMQAAKEAAEEGSRAKSAFLANM
ncbi:MAG: PAS domain-containing protein, partial [Oscillochloris sp.]|nr:PAS domain-containing protein [Oscillochloris sp.]